MHLIGGVGKKCTNTVIKAGVNCVPISAKKIKRPFLKFSFHFLDLDCSSQIVVMLETAKITLGTGIQVIWQSLRVRDDSNAAVVQCLDIIQETPDAIL